MAKVDRDSFMSIQGWMLTDYGLKGDHLIAFAVIHGFSQDGAGWYFGGREYLADWLGCSTKKVSRILNQLVSSGYLKRQQADGKSGKCYKYKTVERDKTSHSNETKRPIQRDNMSHSKGQNEPIERDKTSHINIKETLTEQETKKSRGFQPPTLEQVKAYIKEKGYSVNAEQWYYHYESNGWMVGRNKMKDWKASVRYWESKEKKGTDDGYVSEYADLF